MTLAWMRRDYERQEFLKKVLKEIRDEEERSLNSLSFKMILCRALMSNFEESTHTSFTVRAQTKGDMYFRQSINPAFNEFCRSTEEKNSLLGKLLLLLTESLYAELSWPLRQQEFENPQILFDGHLAMDEVSLVDE